MVSTALRRVRLITLLLSSGEAVFVTCDLLLCSGTVAHYRTCVGSYATCLQRMRSVGSECAQLCSTYPPGRCRQREGRSRGPRLRVGIPLCLPPSLRVPLSAVLPVVITSCPGSGGTCAHDNYACAAGARWPQGCQVRTAALRGAVDRGAASCPSRMSIVDLVIVSAVGLATPGPPTRWPPRCASPALASDVHGRWRCAYPR